MTRDEIFRLARDAWLYGEIYDLTSFAELVAAAEREACAKVCEQWGSDQVAKWEGDEEMSTDAKARAWDALMCAAAIRARGVTADTPTPPASA